MKQHKKGLIFALDGAIAVTVVVLMVINSVYYFSVASKSSLSHLQAVKLAEDIVTVYDSIGAFDAIMINNTKGPFSNAYNITQKQLNLSRFLPSNYDMWVSVSDLKETLVDPNPCVNSFPSTYTNFKSEPLERNMPAFLQVNVSMLGTGPGVGALHIQLNGVLMINNYPFKGKLLTSSFHTFGPLPFKKGVNNVEFRIDGGCIMWYRILGTEAYAGSTNETLVYSDSFPKDRFVGAGERFFTVIKTGDVLPTESAVEGTHLIRYRLWLKGGT